MRKFTVFISIYFLISLGLSAQVGIGTSTPNPSALLDISGTNKGLLVPRVALTSATAAAPVSNPLTSLLIYNTATAGSGATAVAPGFYYWNGTSWVGLSTSILQQNLNTNGKFISADGGSDGISLGSNGILVSTGVYGAGNALTDAGAGTRLIWYPKKASFRAGQVNGTEWDDANIGNNSIAFGNANIASGVNTFASGNLCIANNDNAVAIGNQNKATGAGSLAVGELTTASGPNSSAFGVQTSATGRLTTALGNNTLASGTGATALGAYTKAIGSAAVAIGSFTTADGEFSTAMGNYVSTNLKEGAFVIGDNSTFTPLNNSVDNQFAARFVGGYSLFTNATATVGVQVVPGGNAWSTISDKKRKENFAPVNGEDFLSKIDKFDLVSWNYKGQDAKAFRHYGPMAQDFYNAFGKDNYGTIGNDTTINQADFDGINLIAIQALEKRTADLKKENEAMKQQLAKVAFLEKENESLKQSFAQLQASFEDQKKEIADRLKQMEELAVKQSTKTNVAAK